MFAVCKHAGMQTLPTTPTALSAMLGISIPYASQILRDKRPWPRALAITAYRLTGQKVGPIADATDEEIAVLERFEERAA